jgi:hypothetical protein
VPAVNLTEQEIVALIATQTVNQFRLLNRVAELEAEVARLEKLCDRTEAGKLAFPQAVPPELDQC